MGDNFPGLLESEGGIELDPVGGEGDILHVTLTFKIDPGLIRVILKERGDRIVDPLPGGDRVGPA